VADAGADDLDEEEKGVSVAVHTDFSEVEDMAAGFAFLPEAVARAGKKVDIAGALRLFERLGIQVAKHQDFAGFVVLHDSRDESAKFFKRELHSTLLKIKNPPGRFAPAGRVELKFQ
jgi:hypothetical protein